MQWEKNSIYKVYLKPVGHFKAKFIASSFLLICSTHTCKQNIIWEGYSSFKLPETVFTKETIDSVDKCKTKRRIMFQNALTYTNAEWNRTPFSLRLTKLYAHARAGGGGGGENNDGGLIGYGRRLEAEFQWYILAPLNPLNLYLRSSTVFLKSKTASGNNLMRERERERERERALW